MEKAYVLNKNTSFGSIILLVFVIALTGVMYLYNNMLSKDITDLQASISSMEWQIMEIEKNKNIQIYTLLKANQETINNLISKSKVTSFIKHLDETSKLYNLQFEWFNLLSGQIRTKWISITNGRWLSYQKISDFIKNYRWDSKNLFELWFVDWLSWVEDIKFNLKFKVK